MPTPEPLVRLLHAAYAAPAAGVADGELLARVAAGKDDAAFELLVRRYADLVWKVCRGVARDHHAAEDAFQAAFLALATRAGTVHGAVGGWLYRVAYHAALKARPASGPRERAVAARVAEQPAPAGRSPEDLELVALLHAELTALAAAYREPVVLCHLHGLTQAEAAAQLGLPVGTVATRVRRGLARLRDRLARRGVSAPAAGVAAALAADAAAAPPRLVGTAAAFPTTPAPPAVVRLSEGALAAMKPLPWKSAALAAAVLAGAAALTAATADPPRPADPPPPPAARKAAPAPSTYAQRKQSRDRLARIGIALHDYAEARGHFPTDVRSKDGKPLLSWRVAVLPQLDQEYLYAQFRLDEPWDSEHNKKLLKYAPRVYRSAADPGRTLVKAFAGPQAAFEPGKAINLPHDFPDGTSNTILAVEAGPAVEWTKPEDLPYHPKKPLPRMDGPYTDRLFALFADGAVWDLRWNLPEAQYRRLIERADGQVIGSGLDAPPAKPQTDEEKKQAERMRKWLANDREYLRQLAAERTKLREELDRAGGAPPGEAIPDDASIEELERESRRLHQQQEALRDDVERLRAELAKRKKRKE